MSRFLAAFRLAVAIVCLVVAILIFTIRIAVPQAVPLMSATVLVTFAAVCLMTLSVFVTWMMPKFEATQIIPSRVRDALNTFQDGLLVIDENERIVVANRALRQRMQLSPSDLLGRQASSLKWICSRDTTKGDFPWMRALGGQPGNDSETLLRYQRRDKQLLFFSVSAARIESDDSAHQGALVTLRDVTRIEQQRAEMERMLAVLRANREEISRKNVELQSLADCDAMTGCLNRRAFLRRFQEHIENATESQSSIACIMVDNDHFKLVNDTHGHSVGDQVIQRVATVLCETFDGIGEICRYGGKEFCIVLGGVDLDQAAVLAEQARTAIESIRLDDPTDLRLTASLGVTTATEDCSPQELIDQADKCLYVAKNRGRNQVVTYNEEIRATSIASLSDATGASHDVSLDVDLERIPFHAVMGLVSALAYRDAATAEHSRRVANLCVRAATSLLDQRGTYILEMAALLHDVGKIALPDDVLQKPGPLTPDQWRLIAKHHRIGVEIVLGTFHHQELCRIIETHMAFYGGLSLIAGLPTGRKIPLAARLLTIADTYDVITSDRPHRAGQGHDDAVAELRRCAGTQFDPVLVEHFIASLHGNHRISGMAQTISRRTALEIGVQIEQLARAIDNQDIGQLQFLATRLHAVAEHHQIVPIANAARQLQCDAAGEDVQWIDVLDHTHHLLNLCRATQDAYLVDHAKLAD